MSKKVLTIRLPENKHQQLTAKIGSYSLNQIFERLTDLIINESILISPQGIHFRQQSDSTLIADTTRQQSDSNMTASNEVMEIKKQIDCIMTALELKGNSSLRLDDFTAKLNQLDSKVIALSDRQHCDCKVIADKPRQHSDSILTALDENQLTLFESNGNEEAIGEVIGDESPETVEPLPGIDLKVIADDNIEVMPSENELESSAIDEGIKTREDENDEVKSDSEGANLETTEKKLTKQERRAILNEIPKGTQFFSADLLKLIGLKETSNLRTNRGNKENPKPNPYLLFFDVEKVKVEGKPVNQYTRNDYVLVDSE